jgi:hypothetical protein
LGRIGVAGLGIFQYFEEEGPRLLDFHILLSRLICSTRHFP